MLLGVISDTHGRLNTTERAIEALKAAGVDQIVHCGDVGGATVVELFQSIPTHFVVGNCDSAMTLQMAVEAAGHTFHGRVGELTLAGRRIAFLHGDSDMALQWLLDEGHWDLVAHGHTHQAGCQRFRQTVFLNPGAMVRCEKPSVALVRLPDLEITPVALEWD